METQKRQNIQKLGLYDAALNDDLAGVFTHGLFEDIVKASPIRTTLHKHTFHELVIFSEGSADYLADFEAYQITAPCAVLIPSGTVHRWENTETLKGHIMAFDLDFLAARGRARGPASILRPPVPVVIPLTEDELHLVNDSLVRIQHEYLSECPNRKHQMRALLTIILIDLRRIHDRLTDSLQTSADKLYSSFLDTLEEHWQTHGTPKELATILGISADHLSASLRSVTGKNASELIQERILLEAKRQLAHSRLSVSEIAYHTGFEDPSYFTRFFKKLTSTTPTAFREQLLATSSKS